MSDVPIFDRLTPAELRTLEAMREADTELAAAKVLGLSAHTVHTNLRNVRSKLGVRSTRQALVAIDGIPRWGVAASD